MKLFALLAAFLFAANVFAVEPLTNFDEADGIVVVKVEYQTTVTAQDATNAIWIASGTQKSILVEEQGTDERPLYSVNFLITGDMGLHVDLTTARTITREDAETEDLTVTDIWEYKDAAEAWVAFEDNAGIENMQLLGGDFGTATPTATTTHSQLKVRAYPSLIECANTVTPGEYTITYTLTATNNGYDTGYDQALVDIATTY